VSALNKQKLKHSDKVSRAIDTVLRKIFGDDATLLIYKYLEHRYTLTQDAIAEKIDVFAEGLEEFLMSGAHIIEMKILEDVYSSYGLTRRPEFEGRNKYDFVGQMKTLIQKA
jgi:hypothetical protein